MKENKTRYLTQSGIIAAIYVVLLFMFEPISFSDVQMRIAEALTILPFFTPAAIPGLTIGCFIGNFLSGAAALDVIFGTIATFIGAVFSYKLRKYKFLVPLPPILSNTIIIPWVLKIAYGMTEVPIYIMMLTVGIGEIISCGLFGLILLFALDKVKHVIFSNSFLEKN